MRTTSWLTFGLALAAALVAGPARADESAPYRTLGDLPVMHTGRVKPLDTLAREEIKKVYGRESIKLLDPLDRDKVVATWGPIAALVDWQARPDFWDAQDVILSEYLPLKQMVLAPEVRTALKTIAGRKETPAATKAAVEKVLAAPKYETADLAGLAKLDGITKDDKATLLRLANKLEPAYKWLSPNDLATAEVEVDGKELTFLDWFGDVMARGQGGGPMMGDNKPKLSPLEDKVREVGIRWFSYQAIRDRNERGMESLGLNLLPRPANEAYLKFTADAYTKAAKEGPRSLSPAQLDAANTLNDYLKDLQRKDQELPGRDPEFDKRFQAWLKGKSAWVPLRVVLDSEPAELEAAGFDPKQVAAFRAAYNSLIAAERDQPAKVDTSKASAVLAAARAIGQSNGDYPPADWMARESHFNRFAPFYKAPMAYGLAFALLLVSLGITARPGSGLAKVDRALYGLGLLAFVAGIGLEVYGFMLRIKISGWAPVTNMYETVIWVALIAAVLGLVLEAIYRMKFAALGASGVALLCTVLCAGAPSVLDPNIKALTPVLRSNYWLTIHVLTEVSSYAAFALAWALGVIGTLFYLTATYRRRVNYGELIWPALPGLPVLAAGLLGLYGSVYETGPWWMATKPVLLGSAILAMGGGAFVLAPLSALLGELVSRLTFREDETLADDALAGERAERAEENAVAATLAAGAAGGTATLARPTVAEIRARSAAARPKLDARARAMQQTAAVVKPLSNFIYRSMQVGVLLITAGTILGGVWADYSWGRFWGWDPKEVWALITLLVYLVPLHGRFAGLINTFGLVCASVGCFLSVVMAWYGVNFVLGVGLHSYGFGEGGSQGGMLVALTAVLSIVVGAYWRRHRAYVPTPTVA